jgi:S1-C subfamily serine protease
MLPPVLALLTLAGPAAAQPALARDAALPAEAQWRAILACPRVVIGGEGFGTAAVVGHKGGFAYLLTAAHVVEPRAKLEFHAFTRDSYPLTARVLKESEVVLRLTDPDVALVRVKVGEEPLATVRLAPPGQRPRRFPFAAVSIGGGFGGAPTAWAETVTAKVLKRKGEDPQAFFWQTGRTPDKGRSGGPLLDADARLIGICAATTEAHGYYAHLDEILAGLKRNKYDWLWAK